MDRSAVGLWIDQSVDPAAKVTLLSSFSPWLCLKHYKNRTDDAIPTAHNLDPLRADVFMICYDLCDLYDLPHVAG